MLAPKSSTCPLLSHFLHKQLLTVYCSVWRCFQWAALLLWESSHCICWPWQRWSTGGWAGCDPHPEIEASILLCPSRPGRAGLMPMIYWQCKGTKMWKSVFNVTVFHCRLINNTKMLSSCKRSAQNFPKLSAPFYLQNTFSMQQSKTPSFKSNITNMTDMCHLLDYQTFSSPFA